MKQALWSNWNFMRLLRLGLGIFILVQAVMAKDWTMGILGIIFSLMPVFNIGCCGGGSCAAPLPGRTHEATKDISFDEVV